MSLITVEFMSLIKIYKGIPSRITATIKQNDIVVDLTDYSNIGLWIYYQNINTLLAKYAYSLSGLVGFKKLEYVTDGTDGQIEFIIQPSQIPSTISTGNLISIAKGKIVDTEADPDLVSETGFMEDITLPTLFAEISENLTETI